MTQKTYSNIMLDLETMSKGPDAAIIAIGAVCFDLEAGETGPCYYNRVSLAEAVECGGTIDADTVLWWLKQDDDARHEITRDDVPELTIFSALYSFNSWVREYAEDNVAVWGNGASFDNVILRSAYQRLHSQTPWEWWNDRCYRTMKAMHRNISIERTGTKHIAITDAINQARHLIEILRG